jgi:L-cysteine desulfidase
MVLSSQARTAIAAEKRAVGITHAAIRVHASLQQDLNVTMPMIAAATPASSPRRALSAALARVNAIYKRPVAETRAVALRILSRRMETAAAEVAPA